MLNFSVALTGTPLRLPTLIRSAKKEFYNDEIIKYKNDIRTTCDALKAIINIRTFESDFPSCFVQEGVEISGYQIIGDEFKEYFIEIKLNLVSSIATATFDSYLTASWAALCNFTYTNPYDIGKIKQNLRPKSSSGYGKISTKLLKEIKHILSRPLSIIINQSLYGIYQYNIKMIKVIPLIKNYNTVWWILSPCTMDFGPQYDGFWPCEMFWTLFVEYVPRPSGGWYVGIQKWGKSE